MYLHLVPVFLLAGSAFSQCFDPSPAFPLPKYNKDDVVLQATFFAIKSALLAVSTDEAYRNASLSIEVTSSKETLWSMHHTSPSHRGVAQADGNTQYRIASNTKVFTVLGILYLNKEGKLHLDDPVLKYIPSLNASHTGKLPWHDITIRALASQLSGIPNNVLGLDAINPVFTPGGEDMVKELGLPPVTSEVLPTCSEYSNFTRACTEEEFVEALNREIPLFAPNQKSTYTNDGFSILGLVIEHITGMTYAEYMDKAIFEPLNMTRTTFAHPPDDHGVIPLEYNWWGLEEGVERPTGSAYSSSSDMARFNRYVLTHYNGISPSLNWFSPASWSLGGGGQTFFGMPWEIFTTQELLPSKRPVTFYTKGGNVPGYYSVQVYMPEHDLAFTVLQAGGGSDYVHKARDIISTLLTPIAESKAISQLEKYAGTYTTSKPDSPVNASLTIVNDKTSGLLLKDFTVGGTLQPFEFVKKQLSTEPEKMRVQLTPTLLYLDEESQQGERWRMIITADPKFFTKKPKNTWDNFCLTFVDLFYYAGKPVNEFIFWQGDSGDETTKVTSSGWRIELTKEDGEQGSAQSTATDHAAAAGDKQHSVNDEL